MNPDDRNLTRCFHGNSFTNTATLKPPHLCRKISSNFRAPLHQALPPHPCPSPRCMARRHSDLAPEKRIPC